MKRFCGILFVLSVALALISCGGGGGGGGGGGSPTASTASTYSGSFNVNGGSYSSVELSGGASGTITLSGTNGTLTGTYTTGRSVQNGRYIVTFSNGWTIIITISDNSIVLEPDSVPASGTGTISSVDYVQIADDGMTAEERAVYNTLLGTHWKYRPSLSERTYNGQYFCAEIIINADGAGYYRSWYEDELGQEISSPTSNTLEGNFSSYVVRNLVSAGRGWEFELHFEEYHVDTVTGVDNIAGVIESLLDTNNDGVVDTLATRFDGINGRTYGLFTKIQ